MTLNDFSVQGLTAIITGASRGIGKGIALVFAEAGADVCIAARSEAGLEQVAETVRGMGRRCLAVTTDITKEADVDRMVKRAIEELGKVDVLVNNAGIAVVKPLVPLPGFSPGTAESLPNFFEPYTEAEWDQVMDTNLKGAFLCTKAVGPHMLERRKGKVINISSANAVKAGKFRFTYDVSKAGLSSLTRSLGVEWARHLGNTWGLAARAKRIGQLLRAKEKFTEEDLRAIQLDTRVQVLDFYRDLLLEVTGAGADTMSARCLEARFAAEVPWRSRSPLSLGAGFPPRPTASAPSARRWHATSRPAGNGR